MNEFLTISLRVAVLCSVSLLMTGVPGVHAQESVVNTEDSIFIEEILVTARKRVESLMDAPVAVTAFSGESMDQLGVTTLEQIAARVPGLQLGRAAQTSNIFIRGIGSGFNKGFEQSVGMYIDGIYLPRSRQFTQAFLDLQQVEILRGPQGILFGKNTVAGAINVASVTPAPGDEFGGKVVLDWEPEFDTSRITAAISIPLSEDWALRIAGRFEESDGYVYNVIYDEDQQQKENKLGRITLAGKISDSVSVVAKVGVTDMEWNGVESVISIFDPSLGTGLGTFATIGAGLLAVFTPGFGPADGSGVDEYTSFGANLIWGKDLETTETLLASLRFDAGFNNYNLTSITGYSGFDTSMDPHDIDFGPLNFAQARDVEELQQFSQELRMSSDLDGRINFVAGIYYEEQDLKIRSNIDLDGSFGGLGGLVFSPLTNLWQAALAPTVFGMMGCNPAVDPTSAACTAAFGALGAVPGTIGWLAEFFQDTKTLAVFGEVTFDLTENLSLDIGGRWSVDDKDVHKTHANTVNAGTVFIGADRTPTGVLDPLTTDLVGGILAGGSFDGIPTILDLTRDETHFSPSVRLSWYVAEDTMLYLSYAEGYKSGGFSFARGGVNPDGSLADEGLEFEDEKAKSIEAGIRSTLLDGNMRLSLTVFDSQFDNLQVTSFKGVTFVVGNAAKSTSRGAEFETQIGVSKNLQLGASIAYLDNKYDEFTGSACSITQSAAVARVVAGSTEQLPDNVSIVNGTCAQDLSGQSSAFAPDWSGNVYVDVNFPISNSLELTGRVDFNYKGDHFISMEKEETSLLKSYTKINAHIALGKLGGNGFELALYGRNLTNEATSTFQINIPLSAGAFARWIEEPRSYGVQLSYNF